MENLKIWALVRLFGTHGLKIESTQRYESTILTYGRLVVGVVLVAECVDGWGASVVWL